MNTRSRTTEQSPPESERKADPKALRDEQVTGWKRLLYLGGASLFFTLGVLGAVLPGLPATPFLLLTSFLLVRSSPQLNDRLLRSRLFGGILQDWQAHGGIRPHVKLKAVGFVVATVALSLYLTRPSVAFSSVVILLAASGVVVICRLPELR